MVSKPSRVVLLSSTMATLIIVFSFQWKAQFNGCAAAGLADDLATAAQIAHPPAHARESVSTRLRAPGIKTAAVVRDGKQKLFGGYGYGQPHLARARMADDIVQRFLERAKNTVTDPGIKRVLGNRF